MKIKIKFIITLLIVLFLMYIPFVGNYIGFQYEIIHKTGHSIIEMISTGHISQINLVIDDNQEKNLNNVSLATNMIYGLSGFTLCSIIIWLFSILWLREKYKIILLSLIIINALNVILFISNLEGIILTSSFILLLIILTRIKNKRFLSNIIFLFIIIIMGSYIVSSIDTFIISLNSPDANNDAVNLYKITNRPSILWGFLFLIQCLYMSYSSSKNLISTYIIKVKNNDVIKKSYDNNRFDKIMKS
jgi:hypothetical protein